MELCRGGVYYGFTRNTGQKQTPLTIDDVTKMVAGQIGQLAPMDEETADLFQRLAKKMIEWAGK